MKLFNFNCTNNNISDKIINGCNIGLMDPNNSLHNNYYNIFKRMIACNWVPEEVDLTGDKMDYVKNLTEYEKEAYSKVLSQLIFMDSIQTENTSGNVIPFITEPLATAALVRQAYEEALHSDSYYRMTDSIYENPEKIYNMWKEDEVLREKNKYIGEVYEKYSYRAIEQEDAFFLRTTLFYEKLKDKTKIEDNLKILINYMLKTMKFLTKDEKRKYSIKKELRKKEILELDLETELINIIKDINFNEISDLDLDFFKLAIIMLNTELKFFKNNPNVSFEKYIEFENYKKFEAQVLMVVANQALEGIYFYSGFVLIYLLGRQGKMLGSTNMIRFIHRDELNHTALYSQIFKDIYNSNKEKFSPKLINKIREVLINAAELEKKWGIYITQNKIFGITNEEIKNYIEFLANDRYKKLGLNKIDNTFPFSKNFKNPLKWVDKFSQLKETKTNFFEGDNKNYDNKGLDVKRINKININKINEFINKEI